MSAKEHPLWKAIVRHTNYMPRPSKLGFHKHWANAYRIWSLEDLCVWNVFLPFRMQDLPAQGNACEMPEAFACDGSKRSRTQIHRRRMVGQPHGMVDMQYCLKGKSSSLPHSLSAFLPRKGNSSVTSVSDHWWWYVCFHMAIFGTGWNMTSVFFMLMVRPNLAQAFANNLTILYILPSQSTQSSANKRSRRILSIGLLSVLNLCGL